MCNKNDNRKKNICYKYHRWKRRSLQILDVIKMIKEYCDNSTYTNSNYNEARQTSWKTQMPIFNQIQRDHFYGPKLRQMN